MNYLKLIKDNLKNTKNILAEHQINSYNYFLDNIIPQIIRKNNPIILTDDDNETIQIYYGGEDGDQIFYYKPYNTPSECRNKNLTYSINIKCNIIIFYKGDEIKIKNVLLTKIPLLVKSKYCLTTIPYIKDSENVFNHLNQTIDVEKRIKRECVYDQGGYFIIEGMEKVIVSQEIRSKNTVEVSENNDSFVCNIGSYDYDEASITKWLNIDLNKKNKIINVCITKNICIPLFVMFRALGIESDKEIIDFIIFGENTENSQKIKNFLTYSLSNSARKMKFNNNMLRDKDKFKTVQNGIYNKISADKYLNRKIPYINGNIYLLADVLYNQFLPHMYNEGNNLINKAMFLGFMVNKLIKTYLEIIPLTDKDNWSLKRIQTPGFMLGYDLFRKYYEKFTKEIIKQKYYILFFPIKVPQKKRTKPLFKNIL